MSQVAFEIAIIFLLLIANGVFAMAEIAVVSSKKARLRRLADQGNGKARIALELAESPNRFLSTVQIGITLVGIFAGAFGGATLATELAGPIGQISFLAPYADKIAFGIVVAVITYFSLVLGELVPKRFGLSNPEGIAMAVARPMNWLSKFAGPVVSFLSVSTEALVAPARFQARKGSGRFRGGSARDDAGRRPGRRVQQGGKPDRPQRAGTRSIARARNHDAAPESHLAESGRSARPDLAQDRRQQSLAFSRLSRAIAITRSAWCR